MGENTKTSVRVAIKSINLNGKQGFPVSALREIKQLKSLNHPNILKLVDVVIDGESDHWYKDGQCSAYLVFELGFHDLFGLISSRDVRFCEAQVKGWTFQLLSAVAYLHENGLMHRDIKTSNILINLDGKLKLGDFGLSRELKDPLKINYNAKYTLPVVTLWYRAPELILGDPNYTTAIDVWSVG
jgi:serine/threonine protein kinase